MTQLRWRSGRGQGGHLRDTLPLEAVHAEIEEIERTASSIEDLTAVLRARLAPGDFRLVWELRDAVERLALAEELLRERRPADERALDEAG